MITPDGYRILQQYIKPGMYIIELGDQFADWSGQVHGRRADEVLVELHGVTVVSIDKHGQNRALPYDLNEYPCEPHETFIRPSLPTLERWNTRTTFTTA